MKDVIFKGSDKSMNIAEVSLNFSNEDKRLDLDYDRVKVSRRIYRSGENEYKINNKRVRLRDIRELFLDTGVGKEGYSIIGQGRIDEIILSSPKDRRAIFEEAAGISKHKYRRDEAEKKLEAVNTDLEIIEKELSYKIKDYDLAKTYRDNYLKHKELSDKLDKKSYLYLDFKSRDLLEKKKVLEESIKVLKDEETKEKDKLEAIKKELSPFRKSYDKLKENLEANKKTYDLNEKSLTKAENKLSLNKQKLDYDKKDRERISGLLSDLTDKLNIDKKDLEVKVSEKDSLVKGIEDSKKTLVSLGENIEVLSRDIKSLEENIEEKTLKKEDLKAKLIDYEVFEKSRAIIDQRRKKDLEERNKRLKKLESDLSEMDERLSELKKVHKSLEAEKISSEQSLSKLRKTIEDTKEEISSKERSLNNISLDLKAGLQDYRSEKDQLERNQGYFYSVQDFLNKTKSSGLDRLYLDSLANLIQVKQGFEEIIDTLIGAGLQNIVTRTKDETRDLIHFVNKNKLGRITFLPIDSIKSFTKERPKEEEVIAMAYDLVAYDEGLKNIIGHFLGSTVVVKNIDDAISLSKKIRGYRIISLDLDIINTWGSMVAGSNKNKRSNTKLLNRKKKINDLKVSINKLARSKKLLEADIKGLSSKLDEDRLELKKLIDLDEDKSSSLDESDKNIGRLELKIESLRSSRGDLLDNKDDYQSDGIDFDPDLLKKDLGDLEDKLRSLDEDLLKKTKDLKDLEDKKSNLKNKLEIYLRDKSIVENSLSKLKASLEDKRTNKKIQEKLLKDLEESQNEADDLDRKLNISIKSFIRDNKDLEKSIKELENKIKEAEDKNSRLIKSHKDLEEKINELSMKSLEKDYKLRSVKESYDKLKDEISPFISRPIEELREDFTKQKAKEVKKSDLIALQKNINQIGYFTETALEDFDEISKDLDFIKGQVGDLKNSKKDVEKMIGELESEMKDEFSKNFDLINKNFSKIFKILFMGGDARLSLDSEDFLTAGVEIEAKPPSKSLKSISLLSGGEKALTAVALLFAIFEQNPAPFSILDEIDAALDESNIKRYIDYLRGLSSKTQFIMITHRQTTMQLAEKIHGVTIGDDGISKLYSIAFDD